jgi:holo-[acyl-carrier protein] synthase
MVDGYIIGVGVDLVENERMSDVLAKHGRRFKDRVFLPGEQAYCETRGSCARHYAGRFAVKEAVSKAFGTGVGHQLGWRDIEVVRADSGAPSVRLSEKAEAFSRSQGVDRILISLSHTRHYAVAQALLIGRARG